MTPLTLNNLQINEPNSKFEAGMQCHLDLEHYAENRVQFASAVLKI